MIIVKLQGGLGNQMFQYATAKSIAGGGSVYFDMEFLNSQTQATTTFTPRKSELQIFKNIPIQTANSTILHILKDDKILARLLRKFIFRNSIIYQSEKNELIDLSYATSPIIYLNGYFQDENYFKAIRPALLEDFQFPELTGENRQLQGNIMSTNSAVSIHVRRGDYLKPEVNAYHGLLPLSYYQKAKEQMEAKAISPHYYIFSDDPEWCRENMEFFGNNCTVVSKTTDNTWEDMYLMSLCQHNIIANSSYSWWGAWLNNNPGKIVIAPHNWFASVTTNIVPDHWIKI